MKLMLHIGDGVIIGHSCVMHGRLIENNALIGMNATILHGAQIGDSAIIGAGALVPPGHKIPARSVVLGVPCKHCQDDYRRRPCNNKKYSEKL